MKKIIFLLLTVSLIQFSGCKKDSPDDVAPDVKKGFVHGTVYALKAGKTISGAKIYTNAAGKHYEVRSNTTGVFTLELPVGHYQLYIETGTGKLFQTVLETDVAENQTTDLPANDTRLLQRGQIAYIPGTYDAIQQIITDSLGYTIALINQGQFYSLPTVQVYDAVFVNCGAIDLTDTTQYNNLSQYVSDGGSLYVSDYAVSYLTGIHTGSCGRPLGFIEDSLLCSTQSGSVVTHYGSIVDTAFQSFMGKTTMSIYYDLPQWEIINNYSASFWEPIVVLPGAFPLMLRKTNFNNGTGTGNGGNIYFTTFHNHPNGLINQDMQHMLEFVILNL